ncbi:hypothetical protein CCR90_09700 [Rhodovulum sulfidophilum]|uniref:COX15/CtaA family protein n=1 Tax=Rhodovulum sulfidophilum TaxID=35806 RepID=UPI0019135D9F|nr:COX15/CtaA family protein [Rhodovulum sulfidophilum]MBK5924042.1 hypothetical protein [Rhodovulum sulfidophilum]
MSKTRSKPKTRSIFEEVGTDAPPDRPVVQPGAIDRAARRGARGAVAWWLISIFVLIAAMLISAGVARLIGHPASLPGFAPPYGQLPPLDAAGWSGAFDRFAAAGGTADLAGFQRLYWWDWGVRQAGTLAALVWALGALGFLIFGKLPKGWAVRLLPLGGTILGIGAADWALGPAGLLPAPFDAASLRLAAMTGFGFAGMGLAAWGAMQLRRTEAQLMQARRARDGRAFGMATGVMHLAFLQILFGAMLGALDQGRSFPDWPLMAGGILPPEPLALEPVWRNIWDNPGLVQFIHRGLGYLVVLLGLAAWLRGRKSPHARTRRAFDWLGVMIFGQAVLGVGSVLYAGQWHMALTHLVGAVLLWVLVLRARFMAQYPVQQSIRG